jgi:probable selenium-dependent hydroxylase accessory protein YqeC
VSSQAVYSILSDALGCNGPQLVSFVGAGGKTTALQRLSVELVTAGGKIAVTTTTAMFAHQLAALGPMILRDCEGTSLSSRCGSGLRRPGIVALAGSRWDGGKVKGLAPQEVDALWMARVADSIVVEADGSRGLPLKAFGETEPQLPTSSTMVVVVAGLDILDRPLDEAHVHRPEVLQSILRVPKGCILTPRLVGSAVALQVARVRESTPEAQVVVLLNKADTHDLEGRGIDASDHLLAAAEDGESEQCTAGRPDRIVVGSLWRGVYRTVHE